MAEEKDVDLDAELKKALESSEEEADGASPEKPTPEKPGEDKTDETELSEEEISKLSPRAQKRIRDLADQVKKLAEKPAEKPPEDSENKPDEKPAEKPAPKPQDFKSVKEFLEAVEDVPSRNLLAKFYEAVKSETNHILSPIEQANNEAKFEAEFKIYEKVEGLSDYKEDLKKTFMRDPSQSVKALVGGVVTDIQMAKLKPLDKAPSSPNRDGKVNLDNLSKDELYDYLETHKP